MDLDDLGLSPTDTFKHQLALDVHLQIAGLEDLAGGIRVDIPRIAQQLVRDRDGSVLNRLSDVVDLGELSLMGDGESIPLFAVEERAPHVSVVFAFETAKALASIWPLFVNASEKSAPDDAIN